MELRETGKSGAAVVLLWEDGDSGAAFAPVVRALEKTYRVLVPAFAPEETPDERVAAVEAAILGAYDGRIWGAYGLRRGGEALLALLSRGGVRIRTAIVEGALAVPAQGLKNYSGTLVHWKGSRDKGAKKTWETLRRNVPALRSLTLRKLKVEQDFVSIRPDLMAKRLAKAFGSAGTVRVSTLVPHSAARAWRQLNRRPAGKALGRLQTMLPLRRTDEDRTQIIEGTAKGVPLWSHMTRIESCGERGAVCVDQVEIAAGPFTPAAMRFAEIYLKAVQKSRKRQMRRE